LSYPTSIPTLKNAVAAKLHFTIANNTSPAAKELSGVKFLSNTTLSLLDNPVILNSFKSAGVTGSCIPETKVTLHNATVTTEAVVEFANK